MPELPGLHDFRNRWNTFAREQKISAVLLSVCGFIALGLSVQQIHASIGDPFTVSKTKFEEARRTLEQVNPEEQEEAAMKRRDSDGDGISDYDEQYALGTSPYLRDTDSDGMADNVELASNENPLCARGTPCTSQRVDVSLLKNTRSYLFVPVESDPNEPYAVFQQGINEQKEIIRSASGSTSTELEPTLVRDPDAIRRALQDSGKFDQATIDGLTDEQLLELYDQAAVQSAGSILKDIPNASEQSLLPDDID